MNLPQPKHPGYTLLDWQSWEGRWELIDGIAFDMTPAPSPEHQRVSRRMDRRIVDALGKAQKRSGGECEVFNAPIDVFLGDGVFQPDLLVVCDPSKVSERGIEGPPDLVVEILSPGTAGKDLTRKRWAYETARVPEYLIVDPQEKVGLLLRLDDQYRYQEAARVEWGALVAVLGGRINITVG